MTTPEVKPNVLVVGAAEGSLGEAVVREIREGKWDFGDVATAGIQGEKFKMDLTRGPRISEVLTQLRPDYVVCTVGMNEPAGLENNFLQTVMRTSFDINVVCVMDLLRHFVASPVRPVRAEFSKKFVAISSNSARIPRRRSMAYCASKAALSMALRVAARELAESKEVAVWGYEPGLLADTPMTREVLDALAGMGPNLGQFRMHRMKGVAPEGIPAADLAQRIVTDLASASDACNGLIFPFDADEL